MLIKVAADCDGLARMTFGRRTGAMEEARASSAAALREAGEGGGEFVLGCEGPASTKKSTPDNEDDGGVGLNVSGVNP